MQNVNVKVDQSDKEDTVETFPIDKVGENSSDGEEEEYNLDNTN